MILRSGVCLWLALSDIYSFISHQIYALIGINTYIPIAIGDESMSLMGHAQNTHSISRAWGGRVQ